jgi:hypothetical protein
MKTLYWRYVPVFKRGLLKLLNNSGLLKYINLEWFFSINSVNFRIPVTRGIGYDNIFMTEMWMVEVLNRLIPLKPGVFLDVGPILDKHYSSYEPYQNQLLTSDWSPIQFARPI